MNKRKLLALVLTGVMAISTLAGCGSSDTKTSDTDVKTSETAETSDKNVLRVGMECAYAPFNWTQDSDTTRMEARRFRFMDLTIMHMDMMWQ